MLRKLKSFSTSLKKTVAASKRIVVATHVDPDGDGVCAALAGASLIAKCGGRVAGLYCPSLVPQKYSFLMAGRKFTRRPPPHDLLVAVDSAGLDRIFPHGRPGTGRRPPPPIINIDHHRSNTRFGSLNYVDTRASSACEIVYRLFGTLRVKVSPADARVLFGGLFVETGGFAYANTTRPAMNMAAELVNIGITPAPIVKKLQVRTLSATRLLSAVLATIEVSDGIGTMELTLDMLRGTGAQPSDSEHFISFLQATSGVRVSLFFREGKSATRVSLRSDGSVDADRIARRFGGGGHRVASGVRLARGLNATKRLLLAAVKKALRRRK